MEPDSSDETCRLWNDRHFKLIPPGTGTCFLQIREID